jgi:Glycosyl hydrolase family 9/Cellulase N-terminal ig-like domain
MNRKNNKIKAILVILVVWVAAISFVKFWPKEEDSNAILINQNGYLPFDNNKRVLFQTDTEPANSDQTLTFEVISQSNQTSVFKSKMNFLGKLWEHYYYEGNFSQVRANDTYLIKINAFGKEYSSYPFDIDTKIFDKTLELAYQFFYYQRTGCAVDSIILGYPGHGPCHLDDANFAANHSDPNSWRNLTGGWFDAGDYNKYNGYTLLSVYSLAQAFDENPSFFSTSDRKSTYPNTSYAMHHSDSIPDIIEEAIWGADFLVKCINPNGSMVGKVGSNDVHGWYGYTGIPEMETDGDPNTPLDNRKYDEQAWLPFIGVAALLKLSKILSANNWYSERANEYFAQAMKVLDFYTIFESWTIERLNWDLLMCYIELYEVSGNQTYLTKANIEAEKIIKSSSITKPGFGHTGVDNNVIALAEWLKINKSASALLKVQNTFENRWKSFWEPMSNSSDPSNYFQLLKGNHSTYGEFYFWSTEFPNTGDWNVGQNSYYLCAARAAIMGYNLTQDEKYLNFALRQLDWILGLNPLDMCMMENIGSQNPTAYHHRLDAQNENRRGAVPGCVPNGIIRTPPTDKGVIQPDSPWFDFNQPYLENSGANYQSNEPWLSHNCYYILTASALIKNI